MITFETRDNAAKVAPTTSSFHGGGSQHGMHGGGHGHHRIGSRRYDGQQKAIQFRSSSSQTTFLDRNIISTLGVSKSGKPQAAIDTAVDAGRVAAANRAATAAAKQTAAAAASKPAAPAAAAAKSKDHSKDSAHGYASSLATTKRASIGGTTADGKDQSVLMLTFPYFLVDDS